jgi:ABC-2 type transport system ATP-binding protein
MIHTRALSRTFKMKGGTVEAVRGIDLHVEEGELVAFLGPNGAGKSTTLRMLTTLLVPSSGNATVAGCDVQTDPVGVRRRIGYLGQGNSAGTHQRVHDEMVSQGCAYGLSRRDARQRAGDLLDSLHLADMSKRDVSTLSGGQRRRLDVAIALVHRPTLLFLDEPSTGLDPQNRANLWEHILDIRRQRGTTVFLTTHYLDEADTIADRVLIIDHGRVIADGTPEQLKGNLAGDWLTITTGAEADAGRAAQIAERETGAHEVTVSATSMSLRVAEGTAVLPEYLRALDHAGVKVRTAEVVRPTLDDVFLTLTGRTLREGDQGAET